ncbi:hypothetical protein MJO29_006724 [Puccinia striiformis f. sp. tritici]|nr:hypothetical protein MJO29_006724 [Puccinia striiformis f. sp. tritici]
MHRAAAQKPCSPTEGTSACDSHFTSQHSQSEVNPSPYNSGVRQQRALAHLNRRFTSKVSKATIDRVGQLIDPTDGSDSEIANANGEDC